MSTITLNAVRRTGCRSARTVARSVLPVCTAALLATASLPAAASIIYGPDSWVTDANGSGNYLIKVSNDGNGGVDIEATVDPWNAELLGIFFDLGDVDVIGATVFNSPSTDGLVQLAATDTTSHSCNATKNGNGPCNLNGLNPPVPTPDGDWEFTFQLGVQGGKDLRQTYSWNLAGAIDTGTGLPSALDESFFGFAGVRAQNYCSSGVLPSGNCDGSDKSYTLAPNGGNTGEVPEPGVLALLAAGGFGLFARRRKRQLL